MALFLLEAKGGNTLRVWLQELVCFGLQVVQVLNKELRKAFKLIYFCFSQPSELCFDLQVHTDGVSRTSRPETTKRMLETPYMTGNPYYAYFHI